MQRFQQTKHALGSAAYLTVVLEDDVSPDLLLHSLWEQINSFEQRFSRFLPTSELSTFNLAAGSKQAVSQDFLSLLVKVNEMGRRTEGFYNPFILPSLQRAGYKGSWPKPQTADTALNFESRSSAQWSDIEIGDTWARIPENTALDFGGIGKGYLLDLLAESLQEKAIDNYWLSLGGDVLCSGHDVTGGPWRIALQHARDEGKTVAAVKNVDGRLAVATSGITKRQGISERGTWHHIIDPRSGVPAKTDLLTATVSSDSATLADVAAKCLVIAGSKKAAETLRKLGEHNAILQIAQHNAVIVEKIGTVWSA